MSTFEYIATFVIVLLGLGLSKLVVNFVKIIKAKGRKLSTYHTMAVITLALLHLQFWIGLADEFGGQNKIAVLNVIAIIIPVIFLTACVEFLVPSKSEIVDNININDYYWNNCGPFSFLLAGFVASSIIADYAINQELRGEEAMMIRMLAIPMLLLMGVCGDGQNPNHKFIHLTFLGILFMMLVLFIFKYSYVLELG